MKVEIVEFHPQDMCACQDQASPNPNLDVSWNHAMGTDDLLSKDSKIQIEEST